jgi:type II secretory pathway component GspD/PulD (secretin)
MKKGLRLALVGLGLVLVITAVHAQEQVKTKRSLVVVKHAEARELAVTLAKHFKAEPGVEIVADAASNSLLINAPSSVEDELFRLLPTLDRPARMVHVEVILAEVLPHKKEGFKDVDEKEFTGSAAAVLGKLKALEAGNRLGAVRRVQLHATENQVASVKLGASKPTVTGSVNTFGGKGGKGGSTRTIVYREAGTTVKCTPRVSPGKTISLDLRLEESRPHTPENGVVITTDENDTPIRASEIHTTTVDTKLTLASGQAVLVKGMRTAERTGQEMLLVIVTARVVEAESKGEK